jgi:hypothetical protein
MAKGQIVTQYDDAGFPAMAAFAVPITFAGGVVKASPGRLLKVVVTTAFASGTGITFYDNASAASGTVLLTILLAAGLAGAVYTLDLPALNGIYAANTGLTAGALTVGYS